MKRAKPKLTQTKAVTPETTFAHEHKDAAVVGSGAPPQKASSLVGQMVPILQREPVLVVTIAYLAISCIGLWWNYWFFQRFDLPVLQYMQASDFLVTGLRDPRFALVLICAAALSWIGNWPVRMRERHAHRSEEFRRETWWGRLLFPRSRWMSWFVGFRPFGFINVRSETMIVFGTIWIVAGSLLLLAQKSSERVADGGGDVVRITLNGQPQPLPGNARLLGTTSAFILLYWPAQQRSVAMPIESISSIETVAPRSDADSIHRDRTSGMTR